MRRNEIMACGCDRKYNCGQTAQKTTTSYSTCRNANFGWLAAMQTEAQKACQAAEAYVPVEECTLSEEELVQMMEMLIRLWKRHYCS